MTKNDEPIIVEERFNASVKDVWEAITKLKLMRQWFFENIKEFVPEAGFETQFNVKTPERDFIHMWKITEVIKEKKIVYNWKYESFPGDSFVTFELFDEGKKCLLQLTHKVLESYPQEIPEFKRESGLAGWTYFINERLKNFIDPIK